MLCCVGLCSVVWYGLLAILALPLRYPCASACMAKRTLNSSVHDLEDKAIECEQALAGYELFGVLVDIALPQAAVDLGQYGVTKNGPCGIQCHRETGLSGQLLRFHKGINNKNKNY